MAEFNEFSNISPIGEWQKTCSCGSLRISDSGRNVILMGWVNSRRDLGNLIFIDLRDREGITQIVFDPTVAPETHKLAGMLRNEWVLAVKGTVLKRLEGRNNDSIPTGEIEVKADDIRILNHTETPPFQVDGSVDASETLRLKYRYLELRRPQMFEAIYTRHLAGEITRTYLNGLGFLDIETPMLTKSTPEGARDFLVPSRINQGSFYALPQSPQLFKQILMVAGMDRYYQIVRCFRDEDLRADRQPEFTQIDIEMAFISEENIIKVTEGLLSAVFKKIKGIDIPSPIKRLEYSEAMNRYGTDRPDLRFDMAFEDISDIACTSDFMAFKNVTEAGGVVKGMKAQGAAEHYSRKLLDELTKIAVSKGAKGLSWVKITESGWQSPIAKFLDASTVEKINERMKAASGDLLLFVADKWSVACNSLGAVRLSVAEELKLMGTDKYEFVWITHFPLLEYSEEEKRYMAVHHPFTSPLDNDMHMLEKNPGDVRARAYDIVLNGTEIGGGSIRIHRLDIQKKVFSILGISEEEALIKFGFLLDALKYGAPPHGGIALGFDRLVAMLVGASSIREVIAFPKTTSASCLMTGAPGTVDETQLSELGLRFVKNSGL